MTLNPNASHKQNAITGEEQMVQKAPFFPSVAICGQLLVRFGLGLLAFLLIFFLPNTAMAQPDLESNGTIQVIDYNGSFQDFRVPNDPAATRITLKGIGGNGGDARAEQDARVADIGPRTVCNESGGNGASVTATFNIGSGANQIPRGSVIRFIVGQAGADGDKKNAIGIFASGGGGGGTGILVRRPGSSTFEPLIVAGGGGGAYQGVVAFTCVDNETGGSGRTGNSGGRGTGGDPGDGGTNGNGGESGSFGAGGGGYLSAGEGVCFPGGAGEGKRASDTGSPGGTGEGCINIEGWRNGGFGYGSGAAGGEAGGGGGGYSGGGGGGGTGAGGGGGSFVRAGGANVSFSAGKLSPLSFVSGNGEATYQIFREPVANCVSRPITLELDALGFATVRPADVDNGSTGPSGFTVSVSPASFDCNDLGSNTVTLTVTDPATGNTDQCTAVVEVVDNTAPMLTCPQVIEVNSDPGSCGAIVNFADQVNASDNCSAALSFSISSGSFFAVGTTPVTVTATDPSGNIATCNFNVNVLDNEPPVLTLPADVDISCDASSDPSNTGTATATDNCVVNSVTFTDEIIPGACADDFTIRRTWTADDPAGNSISGVQTITVLPDMIAPVCDNCPTDVTVSCENVPEIPAITATDNCDPEPEITIAEVSTQQSDGSCGEFNYNISRTFTITDRCGNSSVSTQVITVVDETAPVITCPPDITVDCRDIYNLDETGMATATDNCDDSPAITYEDEVVAGDCEWECTVERTWTATDACGNSSSCTQTIIRTAVGLVEEALAEGPIELGRDLPYESDNSDNFLSISAEAAQCIVDWLPGDGGQTRVIAGGHHVVDTTTKCEPYENMFDENGKINNPLLAEMLTLAVNLRLNPDMADMPLSDIPCMADVHEIIYQYMRGTPTIGKMYNVGNLSLGNVYGPKHQRYFTEALQCINGEFDKCAPKDDGGEATSKAAPDNSVLAASNALETGAALTIYPNPNAGTFYLDLAAFADQAVMVRIFNAQGKLVRERKWNEAPANAVAFYLQDQPGGVYFMSAFIEGKNIQTSKIMLKK